MLACRDKADDALQTLHRLAHTLNGSGAVFGFPEISRHARTLEAFLKFILEIEAPLSTEQSIQMQSLIGELKQSMWHPEPESAPEMPLLPKAHERVENARLVYLVEDDGNNAKHLHLQIQHYGYNVRVFRDLSALRQALEETIPAVLIMDLHLPDGSGTQAIAEIQAQRESPIPVIFISSRGDLNARLEAVRAGGDAYFTKPVDMNSLIDRMDLLTNSREPEPYRVLIIDDSSPMASFYALMLNDAGMLTRIVTQPMDAMKTLVEFVPDLILMDIYMEGCNGFELAKVIRQQEAYVGTPIVFLSSDNAFNRHMEAMLLGGDDFLSKPIKAEHLITSISTRVQRARTLRGFMVRDSLTGLLNHAKFKEQLCQELSRAKRTQGKLVLAMIDIDHFKHVNDSYGHPTGDRVIKSLARLLQQRLRKTDILGRYGGEEFAALLLDTDGEAALRVMEQIREAFSALRHRSEHHEFSVTFSCGLVALPNAEGALDPSVSADKAMYLAKQRGRNRVVLAET